MKLRASALAFNAVEVDLPPTGANAAADPAKRATIEAATFMMFGRVMIAEELVGEIVGL